MSYVLQVWESPRPTSLEDADDILGRLLADKVVRPRLRLMALAKALWNQFPRDPQTAPNDPIWVDSSLSKPHDGSPLLTLGIATRHLDVLVPFVAAAATTNGLTVYDPQYGTVYLPDGLTFGNVPPPPNADDAASLDRDEAESLVAQEMVPLMRANGFEWKAVRDSNAFVAQFDGGEHRISISTTLMPKGVELRLTSSTSLEMVDDVMVRLVPAKPGSRYAAVTCGLGRLVRKEMPNDAAHWLPDATTDFLTADRKSLPSTCRTIESALQRALLPILSRLQSVESLWGYALQNAGVPEVDRGAMLNARAVIICGWLLHDERYRDFANSRRKELAANLAAAAQWGHTAMIEQERAKFEKFMLDLDELKQ